MSAATARALRADDVEGLFQLVAESRAVGAPRVDLDHLLRVGAGLGALRCLRALIQAWARVDAPGPMGATALHHAAFAGDLGIARLLIDAGASVDLVDGDGHTALTDADLVGSDEVCELLLEHGADPAKRRLHGWTALHRAVRSGRIAAVRAALTDGAEADATNHLSQTALHLAARANRLPIVEALLNAGASIDAQDDAGYTPLMEAASDQAGPHPATVRRLLAAGSDLSIRDCKHRTALHHLVYMGDPALIKAALDLGAEIDARDSQQETPWLTAASYAYVRCIRVLAAAGADIHAVDEDGRNALHVCFRSYGEPGVIRCAHVLLDLGVNPSQEDVHGRTPTDELRDGAVNSPGLQRRLRA